MASKKHHKQDSTRPTKARVRRVRASFTQEEPDVETDRGLETTTTLASQGEG